MIEFHKNVTVAVKEQFPQASIGGASVGEAPLQPWNPHRWDYAKQMMDDMTTWRDSNDQPVEFDFWTFHPYDVHRVRSTGSNIGNPETQLNESVGQLNGIMDLFETYSHIKFGDPKQFAVTEYGATIYTEDGSQNFGTYTRTQRQWDEMRDVKEKLIEFMDRPDRILNATPFIAPQWFTGSSPTEENGAHYAMWDKQANGTWKETIVAGMYRMFNDVAGDYVGIDSDNIEVQSIAFREGDLLHVILNNLSTSNQSINLQALVGSGNVDGALIDRVVWNGTEGVYVENENVSGSWQNLNLSGEEGAKLTLFLTNPDEFNSQIDEATFYGDNVQTPINLSGGRSKVINIHAETDAAVSAMIRLAIAERSNIWNESFDVVVNGNVVSIPAEGSNGFDDDNRWLFSREVEVPLEYLIDGNNEVYVDFNSTGGQLVTSSLVLSNDLNPRVLGDFDGDGDVDLADLDAFNGNLGMPPAGSLADLDLDDDGDIDSADLQLHYSTLIETSDGGVGTLAGDLNLDGIVDVLNDAAALVNNIGLAVNSWALGDIDGDGFVTVLNDGAALVNNLGQSNNATTAAAVPEPGGLMLIVLASTVALARRHR